MTRKQIAALLVFLKEAGYQIDNARLLALNANEPQLAARFTALLDQLGYEIMQLEFLHRNAR
jgi:hypothetical protein